MLNFAFALSRGTASESNYAPQDPAVTGWIVGRTRNTVTDDDRGERASRPLVFQPIVRSNANALRLRTIIEAMLFAMNCVVFAAVANCSRHDEKKVKLSFFPG
jgi:hypothetical protein